MKILAEQEGSKSGHKEKKNPKYNGGECNTELVLSKKCDLLSNTTTSTVVSRVLPSLNFIEHV